jgi:hypothetical protein
MSAEIVAALKSALDALAYIHREGLVDKDLPLTPDNQSIGEIEQLLATAYLQALETLHSNYDPRFGH